MKHQPKIDKAKILLEALPYIKKFHGATVLIKYGGSLMVTPELRDSFAEDVVLLKFVGLNPVIVHGGGKEISKWMKKLGKESVFVDGLRVTDSETMEITEMVLSGKINSDIVSLINKKGARAVGLSGRDAHLLFAEKIKSKDNQDLGQVGDVTSVDVTLLHTLCNNNYIPVISSVSQTPDGLSLNVNADHAAQEIGVALKALKLILLTDVDGLLIDDKLVEHLSVEQAKKLRTHPDVKGGMLPKLQGCIDAVAGGIEDVHMINGNIEHAVLLELFTKQGIGTMISNKGRNE
jgi:acetylglutamate kinase